MKKCTPTYWKIVKEWNGSQGMQIIKTKTKRRKTLNDSIISKEIEVVTIFKNLPRKAQDLMDSLLNSTKPLKKL